MLGRLFSSRRRADPAVPPGQRAYAIGDVHGRRDLLAALLARIEGDDARRPPAEVTLVLLGDLIDRGPDSAGVVALAMQPRGWARTIVLKGNHEAAMLAALEGDTEMTRLWLRHGGIEALRSWGVAEAVLADGTLAEIRAAARAAIPPAQRAFLAGLPQIADIGDYHFVHAGIRPGVRLDRQAAEDQLWIRDPFLSSNADHGAVIVHGHSVSDEIELRPNRIGLDTGAYASGRLSAIGLEGTERWTLQTG